jgi:hypothetical protein
MRCTAGYVFVPSTSLITITTEVLTIEIDTLSQTERLIRMFERLKETWGIGWLLRINNGATLLSLRFANSIREHGVLNLDHPARPSPIGMHAEGFKRNSYETALKR